MGSALCAPEEHTCCMQSTVHECRFPLWAVKAGLLESRALGLFISERIRTVRNSYRSGDTP